MRWWGVCDRGTGRNRRLACRTSLAERCRRRSSRSQTASRRRRKPNRPGECGDRKRQESNLEINTCKTKWMNFSRLVIPPDDPPSTRRYAATARHREIRISVQGRRRGRPGRDASDRGRVTRMPSAARKFSRAPRCIKVMHRLAQWDANPGRYSGNRQAERAGFALDRDPTDRRGSPSKKGIVARLPNLQFVAPWLFGRLRSHRSPSVRAAPMAGSR